MGLVVAQRGSAMRELDGKTAIVAGGSTLIGQSVAETLAGYWLQCRHCRHRRSRRRRRGQMARRQGPLYPLRSHQRRRYPAELVKATVEAPTGQLDYLVNVACTYLDNGADTARADWLKQPSEVNIVGSVMLMQAARPHLKKSKGPSSVSDRILLARGANRPLGLSCTSKAAILQLTPQPGDGSCARQALASARSLRAGPGATSWSS